MLPTKLGTFTDHKKLTKLEMEKKEKQEKDYNKRHRVKKMSELSIGDKVWVIDKRGYAEVIEKDVNPSSYILKMESGRIVRQNRWHLIYAPKKERRRECKCKRGGLYRGG